MLRGKQHPPESVALGVFQLDLVPEIGTMTARRIRLAHGTHARARFPAELIELLRGQTALHFDVIELRKVLPALQHFVGEVAVVGEKYEAGGVVIETADGV